MKVIVYVISTLKKSGPVNVLFNLVNNLDRAKYKPYIVTLSKETQNSLIEDFKHLEVDILSLNLNRTFSFLLGPMKLKKLVDKIKPDIVHAHCFRSSLFSAISLSKYKLIATIHCDYKTDFKMRYGKILGYMMYLLMNYALRKTKRNISVSKQLSEILNNNNKNIEFYYVDNGIDTKKFKPMENKIELRKKLNLPTDKKLFIWCGNFISIKSPMTIVDIIKELKSLDLYYVFCGEGILKPKCKDELQNNSNVLFTGYVNNIKEYLQASDYYISTSLSEGLPNGVLEALSCGLPCILSNIPQHKYILGKQKDIALFFEAKNTEDLKNKIKKILKVEYNLYSKNAVALILEHFSAKLMSEKYQKFYDLQ